MLFYIEKGDIMRCLFCHRDLKLYPVKKWNKDETMYFCRDHYKQALDFEDEQKQRFIDYYKEPFRYEWLNSKQKELFHHLTKGIYK